MIEIISIVDDTPENRKKLGITLKGQEKPGLKDRMRMLLEGHLREVTMEQKRGIAMANKTCETCIDNDCGLCDTFGRLVEDDDTCEKWNGDAPAWHEAVMRTFLAGH